jgi:hypothetical protein
VLWKPPYTTAVPEAGRWSTAVLDTTFQFTGENAFNTNEKFDDTLVSSNMFVRVSSTYDGEAGIGTEDTAFEDFSPSGLPGVPVASVEYNWTKKLTVGYDGDD